jgi:hypothetical protein
MSDTWCIYQREWVAVFRNGSLIGRTACVQAFKLDWEGKVGPDEWRLRSSGKKEPLTWTLEVFLPNLKGEFKDKKVAEAHARPMKGSVVVRWGSKEEAALLDYGVEQLKSA